MVWVAYGKWGSLPIMAIGSCLDQSMDVSAFAGRANTFSTSLGEEPGVAYLLMSRDTVQKIDSSTPQDLTFGLTAAGDGQSQSVTFKSLYFLRAKRVYVNGGQQQQPNALYIAEFVDRRFLLNRTNGTVNYNYRLPGGTAGAYVQQTLNNNSPWTWQGVVQDLATRLRIGTLTLPTFSPALSSTPENLSYQGSLWAALCDVVKRCGCAMRLNPFDDSLSIVSIGVGATDPNPSPITFTNEGGPNPAGKFKLVAGATKGEIGADDEVFISNIAMPSTVTVLFPNRLTYTAQYLGSGRFYAVDVATNSLTLGDRYAAAANAAAPNSKRVIHDSMAALYITNSATPSNAADLQTRATEVATRYVRGLIDDIEGSIVKLGLYKCWPGPTIGRVTWGDVGNGMSTRIDRAPPKVEVEPWKPTPACVLVKGVLAGELLPAKPYGMHPSTATIAIMGLSPGAFTLAFTGTVTGGSVQLGIGTQSVTVPYNASGTTAQSSIEALPNVASASASQTVGQLPQSPISVNVAFNPGETNTDITLQSSNLTGGGSADFVSGYGYLGDATVTCRSQSVSAIAGTWIEAMDAGDELEIVWVDCPTN